MGKRCLRTERLAERLDGLSLLEFDLRRGSLRIHDLMRGYFHRRLAAEAPVHQKLIDEWGDQKTLRSPYTWKWYVFHLTGAGQNEAALRLLTDFDWLQVKLGARDVNALLNDYEYVLSSKELRLVQSAIRLAAHAVNSDAAEFAAQLLGRLTGGFGGGESSSAWSYALFVARLAPPGVSQPHSAGRPDLTSPHRP